MTAGNTNVLQVRGLRYHTPVSWLEKLQQQLLPSKWRKKEQDRFLWHVPQAQLKAQGVQVLAGRNGAGKSTLLRCLLGQLRAHAGRIEWNSDLCGPNHVSYLPEFPIQASGVRVSEWIGWYHAERPAEVVEKAPPLLKESELSIADLQDKNLQDLSKGQLQRAQLWQALYSVPRVLFLDEPFSGLDPWHKRALVQLLASFAKENSVLISTHELPQPLLPHCHEPWVIDPQSRELRVCSFEEIAL